MPNWAESMQQTFEYYVVDPGTWKDTTKLLKVESCTITWDADTDTLGSATIDTDEIVDECYIRVYLITVQNGVKETHPLGTFLVQPPATDYDGKRQSTTLNGYTPLTELKETYPPIGYYIPMGSGIATYASDLTNENLRAPVSLLKTEYKSDDSGEPKEGNENKLLSNFFVADPNHTWLKFIKDLLANINYTFKLDEYGRVSFTPVKNLDTMQHIQIYDDGNSSILYPTLKTKNDIYGIPNYVEVVCSLSNNSSTSIRAVAVNEDPNSATSVPRRGRKIMHRDTNPKIVGSATEETVKDYAETLLKELSSVECSLTYTHAYYPVRIGDCVMLNYTRYNLNNIKAKVIRQQIKCVPGCPVTETAVYTTKYWGW